MLVMPCSMRAVSLLPQTSCAKASCWAGSDDPSDIRPEVAVALPQITPTDLRRPYQMLARIERICAQQRRPLAVTNLAPCSIGVPPMLAIFAPADSALKKAEVDLAALPENAVW